MSMSTHVIGFAPPDEHWNNMKAVWDTCVAAKIPLPDEVAKFFGEEAPDPRGVRVKIEPTPWRDATGEGFEIELKHLPDHVKVIRFYNSW